MDSAAAIFSGRLPDSPKRAELTAGSGALWSGLLLKGLKGFSLLCCGAGKSVWERVRGIRSATIREATDAVPGTTEDHNSCIKIIIINTDGEEETGKSHAHFLSHLVVVVVGFFLLFCPPLFFASLISG